MKSRRETFPRPSALIAIFNLYSSSDIVLLPVGGVRSTPLSACWPSLLAGMSIGPEPLIFPCVGQHRSQKEQECHRANSLRCQPGRGLHRGRVGGAQQIRHDLELAFVSRPVDHDYVRRQTIFSSQWMKLGPAVGHHRVDYRGRKRHVKTAVVTRMDVGKLALHHEDALRRMIARRKMKGSGAWNGDRTWACFHSDERAAQLV